MRESFESRVRKSKPLELRLMADAVAESVAATEMDARRRQAKRLEARARTRQDHPTGKQGTQANSLCANEYYED